jgi:hypothetical protein
MKIMAEVPRPWPLGDGSQWVLGVVSTIPLVQWGWLGALATPNFIYLFKKLIFFLIFLKIKN